VRMTNGEVKRMKSVWQRDWLVKIVWKGRAGMEERKGRNPTILPLSFCCPNSSPTFILLKTVKVAYLCYVHATYVHTTQYLP